jgi:release factor glutamine methyltransferase
MAETIRQCDADSMDVRAGLKEAIKRLCAANVPSHTLAAELLLMYVLGRDRTWLYSHPEAPLDAAATESLLSLVSRRAAGEPTQYLTGKQEFWGLEFEVSPAVLIPRPETEHVVEVALERLGAGSFASGLAAGRASTFLRIADVGTGSGCIAVALAHELPQANIVATDISVEALEVAKRNASRHGVADRIHFFPCDLLGAVSHSSLPLDLIVSNPPYIARDEAGQLPREVRDHEPETALFAGPDGTEIYERLIQQAGALLRPEGNLVLELGYNSAERVRAIFAGKLGWTDLRITNDFAGIPRVLSAQRTA